MLALEKDRAQAGNPGLRLAFRHVSQNVLAGQMERGEVDAAIAGSRFAPESLKSRVLLQSTFMLAQRKGHPRGAIAPDLDASCRLSHVIVTNKGSFHGLVDERLALLGRKRTVALSVPSYNLVPQMLASTDYVCPAPLPAAAL